MLLGKWMVGWRGLIKTLLRAGWLEVEFDGLLLLLPLLLFRRLHGSHGICFDGDGSHDCLIREEKDIEIAV